MSERVQKRTTHPPDRFDAVLLAGDRGASRSVCGINKAFLPIDGIPLFVYVLRALEQAEGVQRICIIGPRQQMEETLTQHAAQIVRGQNLIVSEQGDSLFDNVWQAFLALAPDAVSPHPPDHLLEKAILYIPGDIPLVSPAEIDLFLRGCDLSRYDYCLGVAAAEEIQYFRPRKDQPGIRTHYFHIKEGRFRQNNLHLVKPLKVQNRHYIQKMYDFRYQRDLHNILRLAVEFLKVHVGWKGFWCYGVLHWHQLLSRVGLSPLAWPTRLLLPQSLIEGCVSRILGTRFATVVTPLAGAVLDIDNDRDYWTMCHMFSVWQQHIAKRLARLSVAQAPDAASGRQQIGSKVA